MLYIFDEADKLTNVSMELLSDERRAKADRYRFEQKRALSVIVYLLLRLALLEQYGIDEAVEFEYSNRGKPFLRDYPNIYFNLSHSKSTAACVVSNRECGVDVQHIVPVSDAVAKRVLTNKEYKGFKESKIPEEYFCEIWTIKECFLKKSGQGIMIKFSDLSAEDVTDRTIYRGRDYFCCVTGKNISVRKVGRYEIE